MDGSHHDPGADTGQKKRPQESTLLHHHHRGGSPPKDRSSPVDVWAVLPLPASLQHPPLQDPPPLVLLSPLRPCMHTCRVSSAPGFWKLKLCQAGWSWVPPLLRLAHSHPHQYKGPFLREVLPNCTPQHTHMHTREHGADMFPFFRGFFAP